MEPVRIDKGLGLSLKLACHVEHSTPARCACEQGAQRGCPTIIVLRADGEPFSQTVRRHFDSGPRAHADTAPAQSFHQVQVDRAEPRERCSDGMAGLMMRHDGGRRPHTPPTRFTAMEAPPGRGWPGKCAYDFICCPTFSLGQTAATPAPAAWSSICCACRSSSRA
jgi:hypothetical protein